MICMLFGDPQPLCKYDLLKENNPTYLLHNVYGCHFYPFTF
jgi:hypothetical protein